MLTVLYRIYQVLIMLPVVIVSTILTALITVVGSALFGGRFWGYYPPKWWARLFCAVTLVRVTVRGRENIDSGTSYVFVANHQGAYDIFAIYGYLGHNFRWMMKKSLEKIPFVGWACRWAGQIFVDNSAPHAIAATMAAAKKQLSGGMSLTVFPEGARTLTGRMAASSAEPIRWPWSSACRWCLSLSTGAYDVMPRTARLPHWGHITLTIHKPIHAGRDGHDLAGLMEESRAAIASALPERNK